MRAKVDDTNAFTVVIIAGRVVAMPIATSVIALFICAELRIAAIARIVSASRSCASKVAHTVSSGTKGALVDRAKAVAVVESAERHVANRIAFAVLHYVGGTSRQRTIRSSGRIQGFIFHDIR